MLKQLVVETIGAKIIEKILEQGEGKTKQFLGKKKRDKLLELYRESLDEELLKKYGDRLFYDDLCKVLLYRNNLECLLKRCRNRTAFEDETDEEFLNRIMSEQQMKVYNREMVKKIIEHLEVVTFRCFNELSNPEHNKIVNTMLRDNERTRSAIGELKECLEQKTFGNENVRKGVIHITNGCKTPVRHFVGRNTDIIKIKGLIKQDEQNDETTTLWIYGMGGMGKTQLCRKLYANLSSEYSYMGWVTCQKDFKHSLVNCINRKTKTQDIDKEYIECIKYLNSLGKKLMLFIDNYDAFDDYISDIEALQCHVIITSRNKNIDTFIGYELGFLEFEYCKDLFKEFYTLEDNIIMNEIIHKTGYLALAIELVAKTGQKLMLSLEEYYGKLEEKGFDISTVIRSNWDNKGCDLNTELAKHFGIVFDLTALKKDLEVLYILKNFSILPYLGISQKEVVEWLVLDEEKNKLMDLVNSGWLQLYDYEYMMHPIISYTVRTEMSPMIKDCYNLLENLEKLICVNPGDNYLHLFEYLPYAISAGEYFSKKQEISNLPILTILYIRIAEIIRHNGEYNDAYKWGVEACRCLKHVQANLKKGSFLENLVYNVMAEICLDMRNHDEESAKWAKLAVKSDDENDIIDEVRMSTSFHNLASAYIQMGRNKKALKNIKNAIKLRKRNLSKTDSRLLNSYRNIAMIYRRLKETENAFQYQKKVIECLEEIHTDDKMHPDFPVAYNVYSFILRDIGEIEQAIEYQERAVQIRENNNPEDPKLGINYNNLGVFNREKGNLKEAEKWHIKSIDIDVKHRGPKHSDVATDFYNYAKTLIQDNRIEEARERLRESREIELENSNEERVKEIEKIVAELQTK